MNINFNDAPITKEADDLYGYAPFANVIAKNLINIQNPQGTTIALHGPWGSGKSSTINILRKVLEKSKDKNFAVADFKCLWFRGEEAFALAFLKQLESELIKNFGPDVGKVSRPYFAEIAGYGLYLTPLIIPLITSSSLETTAAFAALAKPIYDWVVEKIASKKPKPLEGLFDALSSKLEEIGRKSNKRLLIIFDDMDRLYSEEALAIFRLIKSVGRLPNVMFLVVYDQELIERVVKEKFPSEGPHFLEKIIQASFQLPPPTREALNEATLSSIVEVCGEVSEEQKDYFIGTFYEAISPYITTPRHVVRLGIAISMLWGSLKDEINLADYVALETLRLYEPQVFSKIRSHKDLIFSKVERRIGNREILSTFLEELPEKNFARAKQALLRIFPQLGNINYSNDVQSQWRKNQRVCSEDLLDTYLRLSLSDQVVFAKQFEEIINNSNSPNQTEAFFIKAANTVLPSGKSQVPIYLDELIFRADEISKQNVEPLLSALFSIHDQIDLKDGGGVLTLSTNIRYIQLVRALVTDRFTLAEREQLFVNLCKKASLSWLVDFVWYINGKNPETEGYTQRPEDVFYVSKATLSKLKELAISGIRTQRDSGTLRKQKELYSILSGWAGLTNGNSTEVRACSDALLEDDEAIILLAEDALDYALTFSKSTQSFSSQDATKTPQVKITDRMTWLDTKKFRSRLEEIASQKQTSTKRKEFILGFLRAWDDTDTGRWENFRTF